MRKGEHFHDVRFRLGFLSLLVKPSTFHSSSVLNNLAAQTTLMGAIHLSQMKVGEGLFMYNTNWGIGHCVSNEEEVRMGAFSEGSSLSTWEHIGWTDCDIWVCPRPLSVFNTFSKFILVQVTSLARSTTRTIKLRLMSTAVKLQSMACYSRITLIIIDEQIHNSL